jgi:hypothetical protein
MSQEKKPMGKFNQSLSRNNGQIMAHRAESIAQSGKTAYKRLVEDLQFELDEAKRQQEAMLDMSPDNTMSLTLAKNFNAVEFANTDSDLSLKIHNLEVKLKVKKARYEELFGAE